MRLPMSMLVKALFESCTLDFVQRERTHSNMLTARILLVIYQAPEQVTMLIQ